MSLGTIFFSYSRQDSEFVLELGKQLRNAGANIWLDQLDIEAGTNWDESIEKALQASDSLLVVLSKTSVGSKNVSDEYSYAIEEGKRVVPVLLESCDIPFRLRRLQYADFSKDPDQGIKTLVETLKLNQEVASNLSSSSSIKSLFKSKKNKYSKGKSTKITLWPFIIGSAVTLAVIYVIVTTGVLSGNKVVNQLTVLVHEESGKDQLVLTNRGQVKLIYGDANVVETINAKGEATFKQIPSRFFDKDATVEIIFSDPEGEAYKAIHRDSMYSLTKVSYIALPVKLFGLERIFGVVKHHESGDYIDSVRVSIAGLETLSNAYGEFEIKIPENKQKKFQTIRAFKNGFQSFELQNIPIQTSQELMIHLKPQL